MSGYGGDLAATCPNVSGQLQLCFCGAWSGAWLGKKKKGTSRNRRKIDAEEGFLDIIRPIGVLVTIRRTRGETDLRQQKITKTNERMEKGIKDRVIEMKPIAFICSFVPSKTVKGTPDPSLI